MIRLALKLSFISLSLMVHGKPYELDNSRGLSSNVLQLLSKCDSLFAQEGFQGCEKVGDVIALFHQKKLNEANVILDQILEEKELPKELNYLLRITKARLFFRKGLMAEATQKYQQLLLEFQGQNKWIWFVERISERLANFYLEQEQFRAAIPYYLISTDPSSVSFHPRYQARAFQNIGVAYLHLKNFDSASYFLNQSISVKEQANDTLGLAISYMDVANVYYNQYLDDQAIPLFLKGLEFAKLAGDPKVLRNANLNMAVVEENRGDLKSALAYRKAYEKIQKELWDRDKVWELAEQEKEFEVDLREKEIALQQAEIRTKSWQRNTALLFGVIAIVVLILTIWAYRRIRYSNLIIADQNQELSQLNATKNRLFSIISHDLKSPVLALQNSQQRLAAGIENQPKEQIKEALEANAQSAAATYRLLNNLLHWSLEQSDQLSFSPESIRLSRLVDQVLYDYQAPVQEKQILLINDVCSTSISVHVDLNLIKIVLRNVLDNAIKFTPEKGSIRISATEDQLVTLSIADSGLGIASDKLQILQSSINGKGNLQSESGTGLGLVLSQSLLKKHGGHLTVTSGQESGTQVQVYLPTSM